jgi:hypothetical protein
MASTKNFLQFVLVFFASASRRTYSRQAIDNINKQPVWFEDISTYPIIAICSGACVGAGSYIAYKFFSSPDVRVDKNKRGSEIRWWGDDKADLRLQK